MVIMVPWLPWLRIQAFLNWHLIRSTIRTIIILFANQLQLRWWELQRKYKYWYCLCIYLVIAYRLIERICDFSLRVFILNGFSHYWYSSKVLSCYQVFLLAQIYGEYICIYMSAYLRIDKNQFAGSVWNMTVGRSPYHLTEMDLGSFVRSIIYRTLLL